MRIKSVINYLVAGGLLAILVSACFATNEVPVYPTIELPTSQPTPVPSPSVLALTLVADADYSKECEKINPSTLQDQIGYRNIFPGKTTADEVQNILGVPMEEDFPTSTMWNYEGFYVVFRREIIDTIYVYDDKSLLINLETIILKYGCPSLVFALDTGEEPIGFYSITKFIYPDLGIVFGFGNFPVSLDELPESAEIFKSQTLNGYLHKSNIVNFGPEIGMPVLWDEAVK